MEHWRIVRRADTHLPGQEKLRHALHRAHHEGGQHRAAGHDAGQTLLQEGRHGQEEVLQAVPLAVKDNLVSMKPNQLSENQVCRFILFYCVSVISPCIVTERWSNLRHWMQ